MPADRAFGRVEQILNKKETILLPEKFYVTFNKVGHVKEYGKDWNVYHIKSSSQKILKNTPSFKITQENILSVWPPQDSEGEDEGIIVMNDDDWLNVTW